MAKYDPEEFFDRKPFTRCRDCVYPAKRENGLYCTKSNAHIAGIGGCRDGKEKPPTNADRIRTMSLAELAKFLGETVASESDKILNGGYARSIYDWLDWLKSPVEVGSADRSN